MSLMGYNLYIPIYLQDHLHLSPLQSGLVIFPLSVAWLVLNFNLAKVEENLTRKALYISAFTLLLISSIILMFGLKVPLLIAATVILAGVSFDLFIQRTVSSFKKKQILTYEENDVFLCIN